jgi:hypothetical protein
MALLGSLIGINRLINISRSVPQPATYARCDPSPYLFEKNRIDIGLLQTEDLFKSQNYQFEPLSFEILKTASEIDDIPELHDRLIAATARYLDLPYHQ